MEEIIRVQLKGDPEILAISVVTLRKITPTLIDENTHLMEVDEYKLIKKELGLCGLTYNHYQKQG